MIIGGKMYDLQRIMLENGLNQLNSKEFFNEIGQVYLKSEHDCISTLKSIVEPTEESEATIHQKAHALVEAIRSQPDIESSLDALLREYNLTSKEGLVLMCLAEAFLRIPDKNLFIILSHL